MDRQTNPRLNRRYFEQAYADYGLGPKGVVLQICGQAS